MECIKTVIKTMSREELEAAQVDCMKRIADAEKTNNAAYAEHQKEIAILISGELIQRIIDFLNSPE
jgi:hypothetical protein